MNNYWENRCSCNCKDCQENLRNNQFHYQNDQENLKSNQFYYQNDFEKNDCEENDFEEKNDSAKNCCEKNDCEKRYQNCCERNCCEKNCCEKRCQTNCERYQNDCEKRDFIKNRSSIKIDGCNKKFIFESNEVEAKKIKIRIKEEQSCKLAFDGETIEYKVKICNDSDINLFNCEFKDYLDKNTEYKRNSFKINGRYEIPCVKDNIIYFNIPELKGRCETVIIFEVKVK